MVAWRLYWKRIYRDPDSIEILKTSILVHILCHCIGITKPCRPANMTMNIGAFHMRKVFQNLCKATPKGNFPSSPIKSSRIAVVTSVYHVPYGTFGIHSSSRALVISLEALVAASLGGNSILSVGVTHPCLGNTRKIHFGHRNALHACVS